jgi:hypothetical protein
MSLIPSTPSGMPSLAQIRNALAPLKAALDERDGWELLAAADEAKQMADRPASRPALKQGSGRKGGSNLGMTNKMPRIPRSLSKQVYFRKETINTVVLVTTATNASVNVTINLGLCPAATSLSAIYDLYWITKVRYTLRNLLYPSANTTVPFVSLLPEYTFAAPTPAGAQDYGGLRQKALMPGQSISITVSPRFLYEVQPNTFSGSMAGWLNCTTTSTPWSGVAYAIPAVTATIEGCLEMWIAFKNAD